MEKKDILQIIVRKDDGLFKLFSRYRVSIERRDQRSIRRQYGVYFAFNRFDLLELSCDMKVSTD